MSIVSIAVKLGLHQPRRLLVVYVPLIAVGVFGTLLVEPEVEGWWSAPLLADHTVALSLTAFLASPFAMLVHNRQTAHYGQARDVHPLVHGGFCALAVVGYQALVDVLASPPLPIEPWVWRTLCPLAVGALGYRYASTSSRAVLNRALTVKDPEHAAELAGICSALLEEGEWRLGRRSRPLEDSEVTTLKLNLAGALVALSARAGQEDWLLEAVDVVKDLLASPHAEASLAAAERLVEAMRVKALRTGDQTGYTDALALLHEAAAAVGTPEADGVRLAARGGWFALRAQLAHDPGDAERLGLRAVADLKAAVAVTPEHLDAHARHSTALARLYGERASRDELDELVKHCRAAVRRLHVADEDERCAARLALAQVLEVRARTASDDDLRKSADLAYALWLCRRVARGVYRFKRGGGDHAAEARSRIPRLRAAQTDSLGFRLPFAFDRQVGRRYRKAIEEHLAISHTQAAELALNWTSWAARRGHDDQAAEASWWWVVAVAADLPRRVTKEKERRIATEQGRFVEAAERLVRVGRLRDAAVALDLGRAVLLTERVSRERAGLEERLRAAGHHDLAETWVIADEVIRQTDRAGFSPSEGGTPRVGMPYASEEYVRRSDYEALLREIAALPGFEDVDRPIDFDDLRAATADGPIAYVVPSEAGGFALVVADAPDPAHVPLPALTPAAVAAGLRRLREAEKNHALPPTLARLLPQMWEHVLAPVADATDPGALVTLVPFGTLAELPLHAAGAAPTGGGVWRDRAGGRVFRYAPNARVLARAQRVADALRDERTRVLTVAAPDVPPYPRLEHATQEARHVETMFPPGDVDRLDEASARDVLTYLNVCTTWHFACHGRHEPLAPLESHLALVDRPLTLRELFAHPAGRGRLAVLSACETARVEGPLLDEVVGFSSAMLQGGVAGVVACQARVQDDASTLLVRDVLGRFRRGEHPARALAAAQEWLRTATNADIDAAYPGVLRRPARWRRDAVRWPAERPFAEPYTWALFSYTGS
jgi:CHAT domain-containing protein